MEKQSQEHSIGSHPEKSSNANNIVSENLEQDNEAQTSGKDLSTFRLVLILAALWVCPMPYTRRLPQKRI